MAKRETVWKSGVLITSRQHSILVEALCQFTRFNDLNKKLDECWTGLGSASAYRPVLDAGLMAAAAGFNPGASAWWKLTPAGAAIVQGWLNAGYTYKEVESGQLPPVTRRYF